MDAPTCVPGRLGHRPRQRHDVMLRLVLDLCHPFLGHDARVGDGRHLEVVLFADPAEFLVCPYESPFNL